MGKEADVATALSWRDTLFAHSLLTVAGDGTCIAHDLQLDYLKLIGPPPGATARLQRWLVSDATLDVLADEETHSGRPFEHALTALWREVGSVRSEGADAATAYAEAATLHGNGEEVGRRLHAAAAPRMATTQPARLRTFHVSLARMTRRRAPCDEHNARNNWIATTGE